MNIRDILKIKHENKYDFTNSLSYNIHFYSNSSSFPLFLFHRRLSSEKQDFSHCWAEEWRYVFTDPLNIKKNQFLARKYIEGFETLSNMKCAHLLFFFSWIDKVTTFNIFIANTMWHHSLSNSWHFFLLSFGILFNFGFRQQSEKEKNMSRFANTRKTSFKLFCFFRNSSGDGV